MCINFLKPISKFKIKTVVLNLLYWAYFTIFFELLPWHYQAHTSLLQSFWINSLQKRLFLSYKVRVQDQHNILSEKSLVLVNVFLFGAQWYNLLFSVTCYTYHVYIINYNVAVKMVAYYKYMYLLIWL